VNMAEVLCCAIL